ncbi:MAG: RagB/SusD family nutrient uptake outer membrane protein [Paraprevotella sp.]|nr:RagB/SusD family nutrient uptake outer membrane protein [Paraprevotella sp.]
MYKKYYKPFSLLVVGAALSLSSCIEETFPEDDSATSDKVQESATAVQALLSGIPTAMSQSYYVYGEQVHETDMGYPAYMIAQTELLSDICPGTSQTGYDWYSSYNIGSQSRSFGPTTYFAYLPWFTFYKFIKTTNDVIDVVDPETETSGEKLAAVGSAYAARAFNYYMLSVLYEPVACEYMDYGHVLGATTDETLSVIKVTEKTSPEEAKNNPRLTHREMMDFIYSDLETAEKCLLKSNQTDKTLPDLAATYAIMAKAYAWDEKYDKVAEYAQKAIEACGGTPMTQSEWLDKNSAFTKASSGWMWYLQYSAENMSNLANYVGWMSAEAQWGYGMLNYAAINRILYDQIGAGDFRKGAWLDPDRKVTLSYYGGSYDNLSVMGQEFIDDAPDYMAVKFRCKDGNYNDFTVGAASQVPVLRIEEMYLLKALAIGETNSAQAGVEELNRFVQTYRDANYRCKATDLANLEQAVITQLRIEFWGEGNAFPIAKRIGMDVINNYEGTNAPADTYKVNFRKGKPNWTFCIPSNEISVNPALDGHNNPDPSQSVKYPTPIGEFAEKY